MKPLPASIILCGDDMAGLLQEGRRRAAEWLCRREKSSDPAGPAPFAKGAEEYPCTRCRTCRKVLAEQHVDVAVVNEGPDAVIKVGAVRAIKQDMLLRPFDAEGKAVIIAYAENLNTAAQNALLALLEEPPLYARLVLLCQNLGALLPTVRSRCVVQRLPPAEEAAPSPEQMEQAERYVSALASDWDRAALAISWEKQSRDELLPLLCAILLVLRRRMDTGKNTEFFLQKAETIIGCIDALRQNASVGSVCGILM